MGTLKCFLSSSLFVSLLLMVQRSCVRQREGRSFFANSSQSQDGTLEPNVLSRSVSAVREILRSCVHAGAPPGSFYTKIFFFLIEDASPATSCFLSGEDTVKINHVHSALCAKFFFRDPSADPDSWLSECRLYHSVVWVHPSILIPQWFSYDLNRVQFSAPDCRAFFPQRKEILHIRSI